MKKSPLDETSEGAEGLPAVTDQVVDQAEELSGFPIQIVPDEDLKVLATVAPPTGIALKTDLLPRERSEEVPLRRESGNLMA